MVLGRHGYETAVEGKNGFVCIVERAWMGAFDGSPEFWNPKTSTVRSATTRWPSAPSCLALLASRAVRRVVLTTSSLRRPALWTLERRNMACINAIRAATRERDELEVDAN